MTLGYHVDYCPINDLMVYYRAVEDDDTKALVEKYWLSMIMIRNWKNRYGSLYQSMEFG